MKVLAQIEPKSRWQPATIYQKCDEPRSYVLLTPNGSLKRRNRTFIKEISPEAAQKMNYDAPQTDNQSSVTQCAEADPADNIDDGPAADDNADGQGSEAQQPMTPELRRSTRARKQPDRLTY